MKKIALAAIALAISAGSAPAADLPSRKAPVLPSPQPMWTGFHVGLNAGYGFGANSNTQSIGYLAPPLPLLNNGYQGYNIIPFSSGIGYALSGAAPQNQNGFVGGGQVGYSYQWNQNFVIGVEADIQGARIRSGSSATGLGGTVIPLYLGPPSLTFSSSGTANINAGVDWMGTVRGRIGFLFNPNMLVYATGGLTYGGVNANINNFAIERAFGGNTDQLRAYAGGGIKAQTLVGWNVGGGFEWMFIPNWSLKAEALYWDMGSMNVATTAFSPVLDPTVPYGLYDGVNLTVLGGTRVNYQGVIACAGVNYHFNWGAAPVVAKN